jgi:hypothetical protein
MSSLRIAPRQALNKAFLKVKPKRVDFDRFCAAARALLANARDGESEEFHKSLIADFLKTAYYAPRHFINTKGRSDLVVHNGKDADSSVGVILEVKSPANKHEMPSTDSLNAKATQELLLYFLRERITAGNIELKSLAVTNLDEWFIFDAADFERLFVADRSLRQMFVEFERQSLSGTRTDFFYREIAGPAITAAEPSLLYTYFRIGDWRKDLQTADESSARRLITLAKIFSPEHLLKAPFANDSQTLDRAFYSELLHLLGLAEATISGRKLIQRKAATARDSASLIENVISQLEALDKLAHIPDCDRYGPKPEAQIFGVALELVITWIDRVLFLKLLEAQLIRYGDGDRTVAFLDKAHLASYDDLNELFFSVLAKRESERSADIRRKYGAVPYLNSALFDPGTIEHEALFVSSLKDGLRLPVFKGTVLRDGKGRKQKGELDALEYLLRFLDSYDFGAEGGGDIQEENKTLIGASVLGLIFEKINGYKDGSYFTPGAVTMRMCRNNVRRMVVDRFNSVYGWGCGDVNAVYDKIVDKRAANDVINSITICDPAVGSGHFLVAALNEIIALKSELKILLDRTGRTLRDFEVAVVNDELVVTDEAGELFSYEPGRSSSQSVQEAVFHEKQAIIENCLFGVDINPNSVKICRLRLWIELLKSAYYTDVAGTRSLETLPNIDINIKVGDSLVARFPLEASLGPALRKSGRSVADYRSAVGAYQSARGRDDKHRFETVINAIRSEFGAAIQQSLLWDRQGELQRLDEQAPLFEETAEKAADTTKRKRTLKESIQQIEAELEWSRTYRSAFEWRFEFPHVLDEKGDFRGFDIVIGNPPYGVSMDHATRDFVEKRLGRVPDHEIFYMFINLGRMLLREGGLLAFILPNTILFNVFAEQYRLRLLEHWDVDEIVDCTDFAVFADATVRNAILTLRKAPSDGQFGFVPVADARSLNDVLGRAKHRMPLEFLIENSRNWALVFRTDPAVLAVAAAIRRRSVELRTLFPEISQGLIAYDRHTGQAKEVIESRAFHARSKIDDRYKEWLRGEDVRPYSVSWNGQEYIRYGTTGEGLANPRKPEFFTRRRILVREITSPRIFAGLTDAEQYNDPAIINILEPRGRVAPSIYSLLGILNSRLATFYHLHSSPKITKGEFPKILVVDIKAFPLPADGDATLYSSLDEVVHEICRRIADRPPQETTGLETEVDWIVYRLYSVTADDQAVIERALGAVGL